MQRGEARPNAKLTAKKVLMLRAKKKQDGYLNCAYWARKFKVSEQAIWFAVNPRRKGGTWRHLK